MITLPFQSRAGLALLVFTLACLAQAGLATNPGYFSHDELQWGYFADVASWRSLSWVSWTDVGLLQWRPLTFNTWLLLSHALFDSPVAFHSLWVALGSLIATALSLLLCRLGLTPAVALSGGLLFVLNPYAMYVHGWVATLADLIWVGCALALAHALLTLHRRDGPAWAAAAAAFALTGAGLLAKEAALSIPALVGLAWLLLGRGPVLGAAMLASGAVAVAYLALRLGVLLQPGSDTGYAFAPWMAPQNWLKFWIYLPRPQLFEVGNTWLGFDKRTVVSALLGLGAIAAVARSSPRLGALLVLGGAAALVPALPLPWPATQYGYGFSAWTLACFALAWPLMAKWARALMVLFALLVVWHGVNVQRDMRAVGERHALFQPALMQALRTHRGVLRLRPEKRYEWVYQRLTFNVPAWRGEPVGARVEIVAEDEAADYLIGGDGRLRPVEGNPD